MEASINDVHTLKGGGGLAKMETNADRERERVASCKPTSFTEKLFVIFRANFLLF